MTLGLVVGVFGIIIVAFFFLSSVCFYVYLFIFFNPRRACAARVAVVVCVCVFVCPIEILRMAALSIELSHVLCIKSNYLQNECVVCRKTLSFLRYSQSCSYERFRLNGHTYFY